MGQIIKSLMSFCQSVCKHLRPQFWFDFDGILHSDSGPEK